MKLKKKRFYNWRLTVVFVVSVSMGIVGWKGYVAYLNYAQHKQDMAEMYDFDAMVERYQGYPNSVLVKSDQPRVAFNEAYHAPDGFYYLSPVFIYDKSELDKATPTTLTDVQWYKYGFTSDQQKIYFTFDFPETGDYCSGCFGSWPYSNLVPNATGAGFSGGHYKEREKAYPNNLPALWTLTAGIVIRDPKLFFENPDPVFPMEKEKSLDASVTSLLRAQVGGEAVIAERDGQPKVMVKRQPDISCGTGMCRYFKADGRDSKEYALLDKQSYVVLFTFEHRDPVFNVFKRIISSYREGIDPTITHGRFPRTTSLDGYKIISE